MDESIGSCFGACCAICTSSALEQWCFSNKCGTRGNGSSGCCGSCFDRSFDHDEFAEERRAGKAVGVAVDVQPSPKNGMEVARRSSDFAVPAEGGGTGKEAKDDEEGRRPRLDHARATLLHGTSVRR
ncbi:hypothetical protein SCP_0505120 [Sparassis crispa]|uniref:Uncharacterized protein n=1 Tax=Sparassis crispa TaxID=139825 RepID=A0A401GMM2_9APHY|nr:hypothetical protein SCP_0505120 [Sparassis crispa]GBE83463.1 hypothetical protein SCP_0505120 [Sparassis crispa]